VERIASGYALAEAPVATDDGGVLFSDALGGGVHRWSPATGAVETVIPKRRGVGGMAMHAAGGVVVSGRDISHITDASSRVVFGDEAATGFNDLTVDSDGCIVAGVLHFHPFRGEPPRPGEFVRIGPDGAVTVVLADVEWANGCGFSPDGRTFYGCDYGSGTVLAAERRDDGSYGSRRVAVVSPSGEADGMAVDEDGALWVALGAGRAIGRFRPHDGTLDEAIEVPAGFVSSLCFGGADGRDLFITTAGDPQDAAASGGVFLARSDVAGAPIPLARV
jgi:gluconolactonase